MYIELTRAPHDWEIIQQKDGKADIEVAGTYSLPDGFTEEDSAIIVGVLDEAEGTNAVLWTEARKADGQFSCTVCGVPVGGLYRLDIRIRKDRHITPVNATRACARLHIGVGDNYIIAGQSNASGVGKGEITEPIDLGVHVFRDGKYWDVATHPLDNLRDKHTPWIAFARTLAHKLGYPVGLIPTAVGGSAITSWLPERKGDLYRAMRTMTEENGIGVKGVVWVQGCTEAMICAGDTYLNEFSTFISTIRRDYGNPALPILMFQANRRMDGAATPEVNRSWAQVREAQRRATHLFENIYMTTAFDARLSDGIHHGAMTNIALGERLGRLALHRVYGIGTPHDAPEIERAFYDAKAGNVTLSFTATVGMQMFGIKERIPIELNDESGCIPIRSIAAQDNLVYLNIDRAPVGRTTVSAYTKEEVAYFFCDGDSQIPAMAFCGYPVETN